MFLFFSVEHPRDDEAVVGNGFLADRADSGVFCVRRPAVLAAEHVHQCVVGLGLCTAIEDMRMYGFTFPQQLAAQRTRFQDLERPPRPTRHVVRQRVVVGFFYAKEREKQESDHSREDQKHADLDGTLQKKPCVSTATVTWTVESDSSIVNRRQDRYTSMTMSRLFVVATPIGNLGDITLRALETLRDVAFIVCEDTRHTRKLLVHHGIDKRVVSFHANSRPAAADSIAARIADGESAAYVSDAGTPLLSDPGAALVRAARAAGVQVVPIPGPSAFAAIVSAAGWDGSSVMFEGFLSPKQGRRRKRLTELLERDEAFVVLESPFRIIKTLRDLADLAPDHQVFIGREMTKAHEEFLIGSSSEIADNLTERPAVKGEFTVLVGHRKKV